MKSKVLSISQSRPKTTEDDILSILNSSVSGTVWPYSPPESTMSIDDTNIIFDAEVLVSKDPLDSTQLPSTEQALCEGGTENDAPETVQQEE